MGFIGVGRFVAAPGFCSRLLDTRFWPRDLDEGAITGPPSFRFIESQTSGSRAEKLVIISECSALSQGKLTMG